METQYHNIEQRGNVTVYYLHHETKRHRHLRAGPGEVILPFQLFCLKGSSVHLVLLFHEIGDTCQAHQNAFNDVRT